MKNKIFSGSLKELAIMGYNEEKLGITKKLCELPTGHLFAQKRDYLQSRLREIDKLIQGLIELNK